LARQHGLEELRDYLRRSRRGIDQRRGRGLAGPNRGVAVDK
jgi:hypothetical protein